MKTRHLVTSHTNLNDSSTEHYNNLTETKYKRKKIVFLHTIYTNVRQSLL